MSSDGQRLSFSEDFGSVCVLLLLHERAASAVNLAARLRLLGFDVGGEDGRLDVRLRSLVERELVACHELPGGATYDLMPAGLVELGFWGDDLRTMQVLVGRFLARCEERALISRAPALPAAPSVAVTHGLSPAPPLW